MSFLSEVARLGPLDPVPVRPLPELLDETASAFPNRIAIDFLGRRWRYADIANLVDRAAHGLQELGLTRGERVGLCLPNTPYFVIFYFAIMKAGGIVVNYNPLYTERELVTQIDDSGTTMMVLPDVRALHDKVVAVAGRTGLRKLVVCPMAGAMPLLKRVLYSVFKRRDIAAVGQGPLYASYAGLISNKGSPQPVPLDVHDVALLQYTGGTTGIPKGAALTHANLTANAAQEILVMQAGDLDVRVLGVLPLFHVFALTTVLNYAIATGSRMILLPRFQMKSILNTIRRTQPTIFPAVPTLYTAVADAVEAGPRRHARAMRSIRFCISGGAPLPAEVKHRFEALTGCHVAEGYGLSEASPVLTCNPLTQTAKPGSAGLPVIGTVIEIRDLDDPTRIMATGERGEVCARGPQIMNGYWNRPQETEATMIDGMLRTADIGYLDADGYLYLVDRIKDLILCSGYNVYPRVIEDALYRHPDVVEASVIGLPDHYRGEVPKAFVALRADATATEAELGIFLAGQVSRIEMPREIEIRASLPRTLVGKLSKKELVAEEAVKRALATGQAASNLASHAAA
ncbi:long-chain fatty acid--CoA ligase [Lichenicola cladoniae]|uniref:Long-chain fatty acid--CoA ligase n=1 Tax=Lichenicola cladoniae TaxID=1484109 RepID=A0A6M8HUQ3_9PROT|nr:long-chain fatty acid--CoA ligase [Lichenicola cladoniae]NPD66679.1 long-chain fatty acid--CoA ligase [Acetobacteraceae bacterium]QKE92304.1 long-chain fatty acid--CoA ligase [Lichenicola cladoniae]